VTLKCDSISVMKHFPLLIFPASLALVACETFNTPLAGDGSFDPLSAPGSGFRQANTSYGPSNTPGQFVTASIANTAFYKHKPKGSEDADKLLNFGTNMKIISDDEAYLKVELDSGEVGWVPSVMVASATQDVAPVDGVYEVYPPLPNADGFEPLPVVDPNGLPPEGSIPTIIDPNAPAPEPSPPLTVDPIPDIPPAITEATPEIPTEKVEEKVKEKVEEKAEEKAEDLKPAE
jgi:hypothetical protein